MVFSFRSLILVAGLIFYSSYACAQTEGPQPELSWPAEAWQNFKSPITTDARYPLMVGTAFTISIHLFKGQLTDPLQRALRHRPLGTFSKAGDLSGRGYVNALYIAGMLGVGMLESDSEALRNASGMFQASLYSFAVTTALKYTTRQLRPDLSSRNSFPSGHSTAAFSFASYIGCRHSLGWGIAAYSLATFVAVSRINDNQHFLQDVVGGGTIGTSYGLGVCLSENSRRHPVQKDTQVGWYAAPVLSGAMAGVTITY